MPTVPNRVDAVVIGSGPNGLVSAALLADAGWSVLVLEASDQLGGAVRSTAEDGWVTDRFSSCYPLALASPIMTSLDLPTYGLRWASADTVLAHPLSAADETGALIHRDRTVTAANLAEDEPADGDAWLELCAAYDRIKSSFLAAMLTRWPPVAASARLLRDIGGMAPMLRFARFLALPVHQMGRELFAGERGRALLAGNAMHSDAPPLAPVSGLMGWLMAMLAQDVGFPSPVGGAGVLSDALAARARSAGAELVTGEPVIAVDVRAGAAVGVRTASGQTVRATKGVVADVGATALYETLLSGHRLPSGLRGDLARLCLDFPTVKVNYRLRSTAPWTAATARRAGVVHAGADADGLVHWASDLETSTTPDVPFALVGQTTTTDPSRSPEGTQAMWAYSHLPRGTTDDAAADELGSRIDQMVEAYAPGFSGLVIDREVQTPATLASENVNLVGGAVGGGTSQLFQQLVFRPVPALGGPRTFVDRLYLGSSAIHPGGGVHGACGALAARAALADNGLLGRVRRRTAHAALRRVSRPS